MYNFTYPKAHTLAARTLARLLTGTKLNHRNFDVETGTYRLASYIHYLSEKHQWLIIKTESNETSLDPTGRQTTYMNYWLPEKVIKWSGDEGKDFAEREFFWETSKREGKAATYPPQRQDLSAKDSTHENPTTPETELEEND